MRPLLTFLLAPFVALILIAGPAGAQDNCYPSCTTTTTPAPTTTTEASPTTTEAAPTTTEADPSGTNSTEATTPPADSNSGTASSGGGTLPITGGDVFSILALGLFAMAAGGVLILSSKVRKA